MAQGVEQFFKAVIVDRNPAISSAGLVSFYHLFPFAKVVVKRWVNRVSLQTKIEVLRHVRSRLSSRYISCLFAVYEADGVLRNEFKAIIVNAVRSLCLKFPSKHVSMLKFLSGVLRDEFKVIIVDAVCSLCLKFPMKHVSMLKFLSGVLRDEFKVIIVDAVHSLCLKFPSKHVSMLTFLSGVLRNEFKVIIVDAGSCAMKDSKEQALTHLCEFIEDCEFTIEASVLILHLLGMKGPKSPQPTKYIRCLDDVDNKVRDCAALYLRTLKETTLAETYVKEESVFLLAALKSKLVAYVQDPSASSQILDLSSVLKISRAQAARPSALESIGAPSTSCILSTPPPPTAAETQSASVQQLTEVPELTLYGPVLNSGATPTQLTENKTEYQVTCVIHIFKEHIVFQYNVSDTLPDTVLEYQYARVSSLLA
ncbi:hypothetical protein D9757_011128 [Collybiopsis confluens]|uniref:Uncharacterized protein n=1 Tax=Collybiopsis confluens TaxID=2823264 RepID=A0A8H5LWP5_9AGAR|nr:hypothetical protein D9757_011128 [Collybiopsis confluens]